MVTRVPTACRHGAGPAPSGKARALRAPGSAVLQALTDDAGPPGAWHAGKADVPRRPQPFLRRNSVARISDFRTGIPGCFHPMDPDEGASAWQRDRRGLVRQRHRSLSAEPLDPRIRRIAEAIGRQLARAQDKLPGRR